MNCEEILRRCSLYLYGELDPNEEEAFGRHLAGCRSCRLALEREKALHGTLDSARVEIPAGLLASCRLNLPEALHRERSAWTGLREVFRGTWLRPVGAVALLAIGFFTARVTTGGDSREIVATRVRSVEPAPEGGAKLILEETQQRELTGRLDDPTIQELLLSAIRDPLDPGIRAESVDLLKSRSDSEAVRDALLFAVQNDPNAGVRLKALEALQPFATEPSSRQALSQVLLRDQDAGVRTMAIDMLVETGQTDIVETLQRLMEFEDNSYVRQQGQRALRAMNASVETF